MTTGQAWPSNVANDLSSKPYIQAIYQNDLIGINGQVAATQSASNPNGDWGGFLNVYYWLASCVDKLIGDVDVPDGAGTTTILGQLALLAQNNKVDLTKTIIVFTSDHGEHGGAHTLEGKSASSYEEAIHVPLFVRLPAYAQYGNRPRTQMVSGVDLFGMFAAMATQNANVQGNPNLKQWQADNPQLSRREDMISFINSNNNYNQKRVLGTGGDPFSNQAYILHTTNEFFADRKKPLLNFYNENYHVVGLRTGNGQAGGTALKLVYYYNWAQGVYQFDYTAAPTPPNAGLIVTEYYNLQNDPGETSNISSIPSGADSLFRGVIGSELQQSLPTLANGVNLSSVLATAGKNWVNFIGPITNLMVSPTTLTAGPSMQTITISATGILIGPTVIILGPVSGTVFLQDTVNVLIPFTFQYAFSQPGTYTITVQNPSGVSSATVNITVTN